MDMSLRQLDVFVVIARCGSVSIAASELHLSQPATSMALGELERILGEKLFDRKGRGLKLNERGRALLPYAQSVTLQCREIVDRFSSSGQEMAGDFLLGASTTIGNYIVPAFLGDFIKSWPQVKLSLTVSNTEKILEKILAFELDMGIIEGTSSHKELELIPWQKDELVVFAAANHPLVKKDKISEQDLKEATWIHREGGSGSREIFASAAGAVIKGAKTAIELGNTEAIKTAVLSGFGIACLSNQALKHHLKTGELVVLKTPFLNLDRTFSIVLHKKKFRSRVLKTILEFLNEYKNLA